MGVDAPQPQVLPGADHEGGFGLLEPEQVLEAAVEAVHHVDGAGFDLDLLQDVEVREAAATDVGVSGDATAQVEQRVQLHGGLCLLHLGPGEERKAELDRAGVQGVNGSLQVYVERVPRVEAASLGDEHLGIIGVDPPVASLVGVCESAARDGAADPHVVEPFGDGAEACLDVAQALTIGELGKNHREKLVAAGEAADPSVAAVAADAPVQGIARRVGEQLREDGASLVHRVLLGVRSRHHDAQRRPGSSNRRAYTIAVSD